MTDHIQILLDPANPYDFEIADFDQLVNDIGEDLPDASVAPVLREEVGYGGPFLEVLHVWIQVAESFGALEVTASVLRRVTAFMSERFAADSRKPGDLGPARPRVINVYDGDGKLLASTVIDENGVNDDSHATRSAPHPMPLVDDSSGPSSEIASESESADD